MKKWETRLGRDNITGSNNTSWYEKMMINETTTLHKKMVKKRKKISFNIIAKLSLSQVIHRCLILSDMSKFMFASPNHVTVLEEIYCLFIYNIFSEQLKKYNIVEGINSKRYLWS